MAIKPRGYAYVRIEKEVNPILIPISTNKPDIPEKIVSKWQKIVDLTAEILQVPSGLITRLTQDNLEIFVASQTEKNPYHRHDFDSLGIGMFCETVAGRKKSMTVQDISENPFWEHNPHESTGMRSYSGVPLCWDDGEVFGTFCMLTDQTNRFNYQFRKLIAQFREIIEDDLHNVLQEEELKKKLDKAEIQIREAHHRIKNHFNMLIGFLQLQCEDGLENPKNLLIDLENRIHALSVIHEKLYKNHASEELPLNIYISDLAKIIHESFSSVPIKMNIDVDKINIPQDTCVSVGLILSELMSNSIKYAFFDTLNPEITIEIKKRNSEGKEFSFFYHDNGLGYKKQHNSEKSESLGLCLIRMLCKQMKGEAIFSTHQGADFRTKLTIK